MSKDPRLTFAPDGSINDPLLLELIEHSQPLVPGDLLKLAEFFRKIPTYGILTERLIVSGLTTIVANRGLAEDIREIFALSNVEIADIIEDVEGFFPTDDNRREDLWKANFRLITVPNSHVRLLIEEQDELFFAVAVSPSPEDLPVKRRKVHKPV